jgi:hypothetical protein
MGLMSGVLRMHEYALGPRATGHATVPEPSRTRMRVWGYRTCGSTETLPGDGSCVLVTWRAFLRRGRAWSHKACGNSGAFPFRVTGSVPRGMWQHQNPLLAGGTHGASGHAATSEPFPDR